MSQNRRNFLKKSLVLGTGYLTVISGFLAPIIARATWSTDSYARTDVDDVLTSLLLGQAPIKSKAISIKMPKIAENSAIVPITIRSDIENTQSISIIAEKNPVPLIAQFSFSSEMLKQVTARIKLADTGDIIALVCADDQYYIAKRRVRVTVDGCAD